MTREEFLELCAQGSSDDIEAALHSGMSANAKTFIDDNLIPPLFAAIMNGNLDAVKILTAHGADPDFTDTYGYNSLLCALMTGSTEIFRFLVETGADVNFQPDDGYNILTYIAGMTSPKKTRRTKYADIDPEIIPLLLKHGADYKDAMTLAIKTGNVNFLDILIKNGADLNIKCSGGQSPLFTAINNSDINLDVIKLLAENGADLNETLNLGDGAIAYALNIAISIDNPEIASILLENGADPNLQDHYGRAALVYAVIEGGEIIDTLLEHGADPNTRDKDNRTPLMLAAIDGDAESETIRKLIEHGADINLQDKDGLNALIWTIIGRDRGPEILMSALIRTGALRAKGGNLWPLVALLCSAARRSAQLENVKILLDSGADCNLCDKKGMNALAYAMMNFDDEIVNILLAAGAQIDFSEGL